MQTNETNGRPSPDALPNGVPLRARTRLPSSPAARWRFLAEASLALEASLQYEETLRSVVNLAVPVMADYAAIALRGSDGTSYWAANAIRDPAKQWMTERFLAYPPRAAAGTHPILRALHGPAPQVLHATDDVFVQAIAHDDDHLALLRALGMTSYLSAPMFARGQVFGTLVLVATTDSGRHFGPRDVAIAGETARRAALAVDHAQLFRAAERSSRARESVLAMVSHDLKNPLSTIMLSSDFLLQEIIPADESHQLERRQLQIITRSASRMRRLVGDLLDASAIEAGRLHVEMGEVDMDDVLEDVCEQLGPIAAAKSVELDVQRPHDSHVLRVDRHRMLQVFSNLGGNAIKFTPASGRVTLSVEVTSAAVHFSVTDTGPGIPDHHLPFLFDRYWQAGETARLGTGLGLAIAKGIVEAHGGRIEVSSVLGQGSSFRVVLPSADRIASEPPAPRG